MASKFAKSQMEKYGWTLGKGLGRNGEGVKTYIAVQRRSGDAEFAGIGHEANATGSAASTELISKYDYALQEIAEKQQKANKEASRKRPREEEEEAAAPAASDKPQKRSKGVVPPPPPPKEDSDDDAVVVDVASSSSGSDDESGASSSGVDETAAAGGATAYSKSKNDDMELFKRCKGVRLGRCGRHRFFDGKLKRIKETTEAADAEGFGSGYKERAKEIEKLKQQGSRQA